MTGPNDTDGIRRAYGVPESIRLRAERREVLAWVEGAKDAVLAVATQPRALPRHPSAGRGTVRRVESDLGPLVAREYRKGGLLRAWRGRAFRGRWRPLDELVLLRRLQGARVPVPAGVGAVVRRSPTGWTGWVLTREIEGALELSAYLLDPGSHPEWSLREVLAEAGASVASLHDAGVSHPDLHPKNLLLDPATAGVRVIDLDRARGGDGPLDEEARLRDLVRLARSVEKHRLRGMRVGRRHALRFLEAYGGGPEAATRWLDRVRARLARGLSWHLAWWRLSGQVPSRPLASPPRTAS